MPRQPKPPRELTIETLSDGRVWHREPIRDDFTGEEIAWRDPEPKGELPNTHEIDAARPSRTEVAREVAKELLRRGAQARVEQAQRRGKAPFPRRDLSPQASAERAMQDYREGRGER